MTNPLDDEICVKSIRQISKIIGNKWSFIIIGELYSGAKQFNQLNRKLGINTKSLADTLKKLESQKIIKRTVCDTRPITVKYSLTEKGLDFQQVFFEMREWGKKWMNNEDV